ncbi:MAG: hypothetical protein OEU50_17200 [Gammaproteobacteria bacterium]|nr:hypothetical protein [Gammaproteobacteria bacterium]
MNKSSLLLFLSLSLFLSGCVEPSMVVGQPSAAVASEAVDVYYIERPNCNFETIAHINVSGGYFSLQAMLRNMRREAAELGADGLYVQQTQQLNTREFLGTARAIRCLPA